VKLIFKNSDSDSDTEAGLTHSGRPFKELPLVNLFKKYYRDEGIYNGEEENITDEEHSEATRTEEVGSEELLQGEIETLGTMPTVEVSTTTPLVVLATVSN
jgi:hypothetical protein